MRAARGDRSPPCWPDRGASSLALLASRQLFERFFEGAVFLAQLRGRLIGDDASLVDDDGAGAYGIHLLQAVGGDDETALFAELADQIAHRVPLIWVQAVSGFIEH